MWENKDRHEPMESAPWLPGQHQDYLRWFHAVSRTHLKPTWVEDHIEDDPSNQDKDNYDEVTHLGTQPDRGPLHDYLL